MTDLSETLREEIVEIFNECITVERADFLADNRVVQANVIHGIEAGVEAILSLPALTRAAEVVEKIEAGLARIDGAWKACPVNQSPKNLPKCPECGATQNQNCGLNITALGALENTIREILTPKAEGGDHG